MPNVRPFIVVLAAAAVFACTTRVRNTDAGFVGAAANVPGSYITDASGTTLGKHWSYSGALVLDSAKTFGAVFTMKAGEGETERTSLHGTYRILTRTSRRNHVRDTTVRVILQPSDSRDAHTLVFHGDSLTFDGPWWVSAGLNAIGVSNPVLVRAPASALGSASSTPSVVATETASSTRRAAKATK